MLTRKANQVRTVRRLGSRMEVSTAQERTARLRRGGMGKYSDRSQNTGIPQVTEEIHVGAYYKPATPTPRTGGSVPDAEVDNS
jgi:hypothetical protein